MDHGDFDERPLHAAWVDTWSPLAAPATWTAAYGAKAMEKLDDATDFDLVQRHPRRLHVLTALLVVVRRIFHRVGGIPPISIPATFREMLLEHAAKAGEPLEDAPPAPEQLFAEGDAGTLADLAWALRLHGGSKRPQAQLVPLLVEAGVGQDLYESAKAFRLEAPVHRQMLRSRPGAKSLFEKGVIQHLEASVDLRDGELEEVLKDLEVFFHPQNERGEVTLADQIRRCRLLGMTLADIEDAIIRRRSAIATNEVDDGFHPPANFYEDALANPYELGDELGGGTYREIQQSSSALVPALPLRYSDQDEHLPSGAFEGADDGTSGANSQGMRTRYQSHRQASNASQASSASATSYNSSQMPSFGDQPRQNSNMSSSQMSWTSSKNSSRISHVSHASHASHASQTSRASRGTAGLPPRESSASRDSCASDASALGRRLNLHSPSSQQAYPSGYCHPKLGDAVSDIGSGSFEGAFETHEEADGAFPPSSWFPGTEVPEASPNDPASPSFEVPETFDAASPGLHTAQHVAMAHSEHTMLVEMPEHGPGTLSASAFAQAQAQAHFPAMAYPGMSLQQVPANHGSRPSLSPGQPLARARGHRPAPDWNLHCLDHMEEGQHRFFTEAHKAGGAHLPYAGEPDPANTFHDGALTVSTTAHADALSLPLVKSERQGGEPFPEMQPGSRSPADAYAEAYASSHLEPSWVAQDRPLSQAPSIFEQHGAGDHHPELDLLPAVKGTQAHGEPDPTGQQAMMLAPLPMNPSRTPSPGAMAFSADYAYLDDFLSQPMATNIFSSDDSSLGSKPPPTIASEPDDESSNGRSYGERRGIPSVDLRPQNPEADPGRQRRHERSLQPIPPANRGREAERMDSLTLPELRGAPAPTQKIRAAPLSDAGSKRKKSRPKSSSPDAIQRVGVKSKSSSIRPSFESGFQSARDISGHGASGELAAIDDTQRRRRPPPKDDGERRAGGFRKR